MRVLHIINGLGVGGAETMLYKLLSTSNRSSFEHEVISLQTVGLVGKQIQALGIPVRSLGMRPSSAPNPLPVLRLAMWLRRASADVIQTWLYQADVVGGLAARITTRTPVVWNLRHGDLESLEQGTQRWVVPALAGLSRRLPTRIICCSEASLRSHAAVGYPTERMEVIHNGFDLVAFRADSATRAVVRQELGIAESNVLVGCIGRLHPDKDQHNFLAAAARIAHTQSEARFLLCGRNIRWENEELARWIRDFGIADRCILLDERRDIERIYAALDLGCSSSSSEGFCNAVGEAMACGVPCVVTDAGDSAQIVGNTGRIVPRRDPSRLAAAMSEMITLRPEARKRMGQAARVHIEQNFGLPRIVERYERLYERIADRNSQRLHWAA